MPQDASSRNLIKTLKKVPIFDGLSPSGVRNLLGICESRTVPATEALCQANVPSTEMYVLLGGQLHIVTAQGLHVATIEPVAAVGIGVITGELRTAAVVASKQSQILIVPKRKLDYLLESDKHLASRIYRNFIGIVGNKLTNDNVRLRQMELDRERQESRITALERDLRVQQRMAEVLANLLDQYDIDMDEAEEEEASEGASTVLIVDDEAEFRRLVAEALGDLQVVDAGDGAEALERIEQARPDLVITDINMPGMDGVALLKRLRQDHPGLPVLAISGVVDAAELESHGFDGFISKPLRLKAFRRLVEAALAS